MKLRVRGNTVRIRVSQTEVADLAGGGAAWDSVRFGPDSTLSYRVETVPDGAVRAAYEEDCVRVLIPRARVERWARSDEVSIRGEQPLGGGASLGILVEKDFQCLSPREGEEDEGDLFPNPRSG